MFCIKKTQIALCYELLILLTSIIIFSLIIGNEIMEEVPATIN